MASQQLCAGELVVLRVRWNLSADLLGLVLGSDALTVPSWLVMWTTVDGSIGLKWHLADALMVIDDSNVVHVRRRCHLAT